MSGPHKLIVTALLALALQACITNRPTVYAPPASYFWLPLLGIADDQDVRARVRHQFDAQLLQRGYVSGGSIALAISTDADRRDDGSLGLGAYAGGYAYYATAPAPRGAIVVEAFDAATLSPLWCATLPVTAFRDDQALRHAVTAAVRTFPRQDVAGARPGVSPDARARTDRAGFALRP